jgi:hypothetical protein
MHRITFANSLGQLVYESQTNLISGQGVSLDIAGLGPAGIYYATIQGPASHETVRLVQATSNDVAISVRNNAAISDRREPRLKSAQQRKIYLEFVAHNHMAKDTILSWEDHQNLNVTLLQEKQQQAGNISIHVTSNPTAENLNGALIKIHNEHNDLLAQGETGSDGIFNTTITREFLSHEYDTIARYDEVMIMVSSPGHVSDTLTRRYQDNIVVHSILEQIINQFLYTVNTILTGEDPGKAPLGYRAYVLYQADTLVVKNIQGSTGALVFSSEKEVLEAEIGATNIPYFKSTKQNTLLAAGPNNIGLTAEPLTFLYNVAGSVRYQNQEPVNATVSVGGESTQTNHQGQYILENIIRNTDVHNVPVTYTASVTATGDFETQTINITVDGSNKTVNFTIPDPTYNYWLYDNNSTPDGATITAWLNNQQIMQATLESNSYQTNKYEATQQQLLLDSLVIKREGYHTQKTPGYLIYPEGTQHQFNLEEIPPAIHEYWLQGNATPNNTEISAWLNGQNILQAIVHQGNYQTNKYETTAQQLILDSLVKKANNHITQKELNYPLNPNGQTHNFNLEEELLETYEFTITPYIVLDNQPLSDYLGAPFTLKVINRTRGTTQIITQNGNQPMNISIEGQSNDIIKITPEYSALNHNKIADLIFIEHPNQNWTDLNVAQNNPTYLLERGQQHDTLSTELGHISNSAYAHNLELYTVPYEFENGLKFNGEIFVSLLTARYPSDLIKNYKAPHAPHIETQILLFDPATNETTSNMEQALQTKENIEYIQSHAQSASGRNMMPMQYRIIETPNDPIYQAAINRGFDYTIRTWRRAGNPGNSIYWDLEHQRIKSGSSLYSAFAGLGTMLAENTEVATGMGNITQGTIADFGIVLDAQGNIVYNDLGQTTVQVSAKSNPGTKVLPNNN